MRLFDTHCHLTWDAEEHPPAEVIARAREHGVERFVCVATDLDNAPRCREVARKHAEVVASVGIHPNDAPGQAQRGAALEALGALAAEGGWAAIGETGLDHYRDHTAPADQEASFRAHLDLAEESGLPVIVHCRHAAEHVLEVLRHRDRPVRGVMHCYSEGPAPLQELLSFGLHVSFAGNLTYKKSEDLREAARRVPDDRLLVETDAPFLAPQPRRGRRNEPAYVRFTLETLAEVRGEDPDAVARRTFANAEALFDGGNA